MNEFDTLSMENNIARGSRTKCITWKVENLIQICKKLSLYDIRNYTIKVKGDGVMEKEMKNFT